MSSQSQYSWCIFFHIPLWSPLRSCKSSANSTFTSTSSGKEFNSSEYRITSFYLLWNCLLLALHLPHTSLVPAKAASIWSPSALWSIIQGSNLWYCKGLNPSNAIVLVGGWTAIISKIPHIRQTRFVVSQFVMPGTAEIPGMSQESEGKTKNSDMSQNHPSAQCNASTSWIRTSLIDRIGSWD